MSSIPENKAEKLLHKHYAVGRAANALYRESMGNISSDSEQSSVQNLVCNETDYETSMEEARRDLCHNSRDEIAEKLSKLKIGHSKSLRNDSEAVNDPELEHNLKSHSIIAGNSLTDNILHQSINSIADSRYSTILAGRLERKGQIQDEHSLLNIAINESMKSNANESSRYVDSLEVQSEGRDSLETGAIHDKRDVENVEPNLPKTQGHGCPRIVSNETVRFPIKTFKQVMTEISAAARTRECGYLNYVLKDRNDNIPENSSIRSEPMENKYDSSVTESERFIIADVKTPNIREILFIEDSCKSSPKIGVNVDTIGSNFITDISQFSATASCGEDKNANSSNANYCTEQLYKRLSQQFAQEPTKFTEKLITLFEESLQLHANANENVSDVSLSRLTEEFRKMCRDNGKRIEDESMPDFYLAPSLYSSTFLGNESRKEIHGLEYSNAAVEEAVLQSLQNFSKLGGGKKVYRKTPRRVFKANGTLCSTPNCANILHKGKRRNLQSPNHPSPGPDYDSTATFEFWENLCYEMSPTKQATARSACTETSAALTYEDIIRKSDQQMASLDESNANDSEICNAVKLNLGERDSSTTSKECQDHSNSMREKFIQNLSADKSDETGPESITKQRIHEIEEILTARLVEKRRKCFEEARKVLETKQNVTTTRNVKSSDIVLGSTNNSEHLNKREDEMGFLSTLSVCLEYFDGIKTLQYHRNSLQCIMECSENSESVKETTSDSRSMEFVEAVILPVQNRAKYLAENPESLKSEPSTKEAKLIAETYLYLPGTPGAPGAKSSQKSSIRSSHLSPTRKRSTGTQASSVLAKNIKSPVSPVRRKRAVKPASHANVPRSPSLTPRRETERNLTVKSGIKSNSRSPCSNKEKWLANSPGLTDVTNTKKTFEVPKLMVTSSSPTSDSQKKFARLKLMDENMEVDCQRQLNFSETDTPEMKSNQYKYFFTPGKSPTYGKVKPKKKFFETPKGTASRSKMPVGSPSTPGSYRINYNTVQSPVGMYIRGTDPNLITNVKGKTNERMLTPRPKTPNSRSKVNSPILARSPRLSPTSTETSRLKFQLTPSRRQKQKQASDILNIALCESDPLSNIGSESTSTSPFPKIFYKPALCVKMVKDDPRQLRRPKVSVRGAEEKIIYRHEGRVKAVTESNVHNPQTVSTTTDSLSYDSGDISLLHQRPVAKSNFLLKK